MSETGENFPCNSCVIVWKVREMNRLDFEDRFRSVIETHNSIILVLMETCCSRVQFEKAKIVKEGTYAWESTENGGLNNGFAVLWKQSICKLKVKNYAEDADPPVLECIAAVSIKLVIVFLIVDCLLYIACVTIYFIADGRECAAPCNNDCLILLQMVRFGYSYVLHSFHSIT